MACMCVKAIRMLTADPGFQAAPTPPGMNAKAALDGIKTERVTRATRWPAARQATLRQTAEDGTTRMAKVPSLRHRPDIFTKPVTDPTHFRRFRHHLLGVVAAWEPQSS